RPLHILSIFPNLLLTPPVPLRKVRLSFPRTPLGKTLAVLPELPARQGGRIPRVGRCDTMYSVMLAAMLTRTSAAPDWGCHGCHSCYSCSGYSYCHGCFGCHGYYGCNAFSCSCYCSCSCGCWGCHSCYSCGCWGCSCWGCYGCSCSCSCFCSG